MTENSNNKNINKDSIMDKGANGYIYGVNDLTNNMVVKEYVLDSKATIND